MYKAIKIHLKLWPKFQNWSHTLLTLDVEAFVCATDFPAFAVISDEQLTYSVVNLFAAGTETTTSTLLWGILFMAENPEVQRKVQEEIDREVGSRSIRMIDKGLAL